jgi:hypothetical protein
MGVWALTQEEKGDAVMFLQISVSKEGIISGAYKNTLTHGESLPTHRLNSSRTRTINANTICERLERVTGAEHCT